MSSNEPNTEVAAALDQSTSDAALSDNIEPEETETEIETGEIGTQDFEGQREAPPFPGDATDEPADARPA